MIHELLQPTLEDLRGGLRGSETLCDIGSFDYLLPTPNKDKRYDLLDAFHLVDAGHGSIIGAAAGPHFLSGVNSELVVNLSCKNGLVDSNGSYCGSYDSKHHLPVSTLSTSSQFAMVGQFFLCEGKPGQPEFCAEPLDTPDKVKNWLKFFEMDAPVISVGTALSHDPQKWKVRLEHFHCFNLERSKCGHCHYDTDGPSASYTAYLVPGKRLLRVDAPV
ncbi:uncharacterized protein DEA37_0001659 [Paragonimus westermani]|uniref:DUF1907 domain-containing protein n=1 Tax=Paragonimus westermani TaxID=34504 RepID=A0A5J4NGB9_9TREM|nr:uncharacterized protein DEA37_0001659 [Paragonimus westermani]